jgi:hypothetical protein
VQLSKLQCVKPPGPPISKVIPESISREQGGLPLVPMMGCGVCGRTSGAGTGIPASPDVGSGSLTNVINLAFVLYAEIRPNMFPSPGSLSAIHVRVD